MLLLSLLISYVLSSSVGLTSTGDCNEAGGWFEDSYTTSCIKVVNTPVNIKDAQAGCKALDSRATLVVLQTESKAEFVRTTSTTGFVQEYEYLTGGVTTLESLTSSTAKIGWVMGDGTIDLVGVHALAYTGFDGAEDTYADMDDTWTLTPDTQTYGDDGVVTFGVFSSTKTLNIIFDADTTQYRYICEVCKVDTEYGTCGSIAQIIAKAGETDLPISVPSQCPAGQDLVGVDTQMCEDCKCWGASQKTKVLKTGVDADVPFSRKECKDAAMNAGMEFFSYMPLGFRSACVYGPEYSTEMACEKLRDTDVAADRKWAIYKTEKRCIQKCTAFAFSPQEGYKCQNNEDIRYHRQKVRMLTMDDCAQAAYNHGRKYFSFHKGKRWCYFGRDKSTDEECSILNAYKTPQNIMVDGADTGVPNEHARDWVVAEAKCEAPVDQWVIADNYVDCDTTCQNANLRCDATAFNAALVDVQTSANLHSVIDAAADSALAAILATNPLNTCQPGDATPVPVFNSGNSECFFSDVSRAPTTCEAVPTGGVPKQRVCWCTKTQAQIDAGH